MKVENSSGREYYLQRSKDNFIAKWCSTVTPSRIDLDGTTVEAFGDADKSNYIYLIFEGTTYCLWAKDPSNFEFLAETSLHITDRGRPRSDAKVGSAATPTRVVERSPKFQMGKDEEPPTREDLDAVLLHLPRVREQVETRAGDPDAAEGLYSEAFSSAVRKVVKAFSQHRFMFPFNYQPWMDDARKIEEDSELLAKADLETLRKLIVVHWRQDYWDYDHTHWESIAANGHLVALLDRLQEIAADIEPTSDTADTYDDVEESSTPSSEFEQNAEVEGWPTVGELMEGFERIREKITPQQMTMLQVNYYSGGRASTMRELAAASGYGDYKIANIQYGGLAKRLYKAIGYPAPQSRNSSNTYWVLGIGEFVDRREFGLEMQCVMRPTVAKALEKLGMVEKLDVVPLMEEALDESDGEIVDVNGSNSGPGAATPCEGTQPALEDLVGAFERIRDRITPQQKAMLVLNYVARSRGVTLWELSQVYGSDILDPKIGWSIYRDFARMVYREMRYSDEDFEALKSSFWDLLLAEARPADGEMVGNYGVVLVMRPEVAEALERLEIVDKIETASPGKNPFIAEAPKYIDVEEWHSAYAFETDPEGTPLPTGPHKRNTQMTLSQVGVVARWHAELREAVRQERASRKDEDYDPRSSMLEGTIKKMLTHFEASNVFVDVDVDEVGPSADHLISNPDQLTEADVMTLRKLLSYYLFKSGQPISHLGFFFEHDGYWSKLALDGPLVRILRIFGQIHREISGKTLVP
jgi:hypothetical protein